MRILLAWFRNLGISGVLADIQKQDVGATKGQEVVLEVVPLCAHDREWILLGLLLVDCADLRLKSFLRGGSSRRV